MAPPWLVSGDRVRVVAPSSPFDEETFRRGLERLARRYDVLCDEGISSRHGYLAGDDARRIAELRTAIDDPQTRAIVAARGGYGATRLLDHLDPARVRAHPKWLVGFSDVTALHALWARAGIQSVHGPMVAALGRAEPEGTERWCAVLEGCPGVSLAGTPWADGIATGPLLGGNLAVLAALVGTPFAPPIDGAVLLLEDVGERPYRIDRLLTTLGHAGWLDRVAAVVLGTFFDCSPGPDGVTAADVLAERLCGRGVPVVANLPIGHDALNVPVVLGAPVRVDGATGEIRALV